MEKQKFKIGFCGFSYIEADSGEAAKKAFGDNLPPGWAYMQIASIEKISTSEEEE